MQNRETRIDEFFAKVVKIMEGRKKSEIKMSEYKSGDLIISSENLEVGSEIFQVVDGVNVPLEDGKYVIEDKEYTVIGGKIDSIADVKPTEEVEQATEDVAPESPEDEKKEGDDMDEVKKSIEDLNSRITKLEEALANVMMENSKLKADFSSIPSTVLKETKTLGESKFDTSLALEEYRKIRNKN